MVRQARLCIAETSAQAYGMDEEEFALLANLEPLEMELDICDCCGCPCEIRSETVISVCDTCREEIQEEQEVIEHCRDRMEALRDAMREDDNYGWSFGY
jgi:hypothetical protein